LGTNLRNREQTVQNQGTENKIPKQFKKTRTLKKRTKKPNLKNAKGKSPRGSKSDGKDGGFPLKRGGQKFPVKIIGE